MNEKEFSIPKAFKVEEASDGRFARIIAEPFERGYGTTVGNALRRVLLASLEGSAVTAIRFEDVPHEFSAIPGVYEDTTDVVLNLKRCRIRLNEGESLIFTFLHEGEGPVTAAKLFEGQNIDVFNPDFVIFSATRKDTKVKMEIKVAKGRGFKTADHFEFEHAPLGTIYLDASFSPVTKVNFEIQDARVGQMTDYDRLILDIWTDGSIHPEEALRRSASLLMRHFDIFAQEPDAKNNDDSGALGENAELMRTLSRSVDELEFSNRSANCLKAEKIMVIGQLVILSEAEIMNIPNFGKKSLDEVKSILESMNLHLGMELSAAMKNQFARKNSDDSDDAEASDAEDLEHEDDEDEDNLDNLDEDE